MCTLPPHLVNWCDGAVMATVENGAVLEEDSDGEKETDKEPHVDHLQTELGKIFIVILLLVFCHLLWH